MWNAFFESLATFGIIALIVVGLIAGYVIGWSRVGWVAKVILAAVVLMIELFWLVSTDYVHFLLRLAETGAAGFSVGAVLNLHYLLHPSILIAAIAFGGYARRLDDVAMRAQAESIDAEQFEAALTTFFGHPELAKAGWFEQRWGKMDDDARLSWVERHIQELRELWISGEGDGLQAHDLDLAMRLAEIDKGDTVS